jgi:hypothetical protein
MLVRVHMPRPGGDLVERRGSVIRLIANRRWASDGERVQATSTRSDDGPDDDLPGGWTATPRKRRTWPWRICSDSAAVREILLHD